jgi:hypothetical protein
MDKSEIERLMSARVQETEDWDIDDPAETITDLKLRSYDSTAMPIKRVGEPDRVESYGVRFRLEFSGEDANYYCHLDVRFRPTYVGSDDPYVVVYVVDDGGKDDEITHTVISDRNTRADLSIKDWYKKWIQGALNNRDHVGKIFAHKQPV